ncbi:hypothetical protein [Rhizobium phaseoli]|uniref:Uncharacterized protein n=1 Tax=Rhizobium phaseoli TaxID=396 RepID=A0ABN4QNH6_9HYPH|nr:hypothetical protein [Rhizobium phaseoli]ANL87126.1 hypothetical protein AMC81_PA00105 [Rhizobium phaseoli]ANL93635.1 hypothetical protein AMC80_PA00105 [Rhizobium phaseoli]
MSNPSSLIPDDRFRALIEAAHVEVAKAKGSAAASFFSGYLDGLEARAATYGTPAFDLLDSDAEDAVGSYKKGYQTGLMNIEFASA